VLALKLDIGKCRVENLQIYQAKACMRQARNILMLPTHVIEDPVLKAEG
jgi:hypothetical protein